LANLIIPSVLEGHCMSDLPDSLPAEFAPENGGAVPTSQQQADPQELKFLYGTEVFDSTAPAAGAVSFVHPLDRAETTDNSQRETERIRLAWAKLLWLLSFLAVLLAISYLVPLIAENTQYAITRGKQRAEHDFAVEHLPGSPLTQFSQASRMVSQVVMPSVVHINTQSTGVELLTMPMVGRRMPAIPADGQGSGFVVDRGGYIVTNHHVIRDARDITVTLADGRRVPGNIIGVDLDTDLAVLKVEATDLTPVAWADSEQAEPGEFVWAVGSPFGLERSITSGILSAKNRAGLVGTAYQNFLQTDTAVNPGNSGGPLVNTEGQVIGVNTAIVGDAYQGISFAVPSSVARQVTERLMAEGLVRRGWLGVKLEMITEQHSKDLGLAENAGAYVAEVVRTGPGLSPAAEVGIEPGDVVLSWNGTPIRGPADLSNLVAATEIGSVARVVVSRRGNQIPFDVRVGIRPPLH
jgi:serine protease Do